MSLLGFLLNVNFALILETEMLFCQYHIALTLMCVSPFFFYPSLCLRLLSSPFVFLFLAWDSFFFCACRFFLVGKCWLRQKMDTMLPLVPQPQRRSPKSFSSILPSYVKTQLFTSIEHTRTKKKATNKKQKNFLPIPPFLPPNKKKYSYTSPCFSGCLCFYLVSSLGMVSGGGGGGK